MKKITTILLAGAMALSTAMSVSASDENTKINEKDPNPSDALTTVTMTVSPTYTVTIPSGVTLTGDTDGYNGTGEIITTDAVRIPYGKDIHITVASANSFNLKSAENALQPYVMKAGTKTITTEVNEVAVFSASESAQKVQLSYSAEEPDYSGTFTDTLTFTIAVR